MIIRNNIGERIAFFRRAYNYTQRDLGKLLGFSDKTCDVRVAQYESGDRIPKYDMLEKIAKVFNISPGTLDIPNINYWARRMQIFFAMEDKYGSEIKKIDGEYYLRIEKTYPDEPVITGVRNAVLQEWVDIYTALQEGKISKCEYDYWRYNYPQQGHYNYITFRRDYIEEVATYPEKYFSLLNLQQDVQNLADEKQEIDEETITDLEARYKDAERIISQELAELRRAIERAKQSK
ncbi:helix-turn-helix domain-containing protein [Phascolarctobacterium succinatutens]|uniref:helix-turn-helix domain-containing protein n=1 Tax=Phascolarctobacterium succinatutens TaxID=626940 RepID=UPI0026F31361|nr:helix-turn-helix transcriptional regulator [Phascolarctobacterium succinatutens]